LTPQTHVPDLCVPGHAAIMPQGFPNSLNGRG
jgi:hypothetical protein